MITQAQSIECNKRLVEVARDLHALKLNEEGSNKGKWIETFQRTVESGEGRTGKGRAESEAWCMTYVQYCVWIVELETGVKSPLLASEHVQTVLRGSPLCLVKGKPPVGAIPCYEHGNTDQGHTGILENWIDDNYFMDFEGNTGPGEEVERNGDGLYHKKRHKDGAGSMKIRGWLNAFPVMEGTA